MSKFFRAVVVVTTLTTGCLLTSSTPTRAESVDTVVIVQSVIDGDTFEYVDDGVVHRVRVAGLNANELAQTPRCQVDEATNRLAGLIEGRPVRLRASSSSSTAGGREYRHVLVDGVNVATILVREGLAVPLILRTEPADHEQLLTAARAAATDAIGVWDEDGCGTGPSAQVDMITNGDGDGDDHENPNAEYVRLRNRGATTLHLGGWTLKDSALDSYRFSNSASIPPNGLLTVFVGRGVDTATRLYMNRTAPIFSDDFDGAYLLDPLNNVREYDFWPCFGPCSGQPPKLVIESVSYDPPGNDDLDPNGEWVRVRNTSTRTIDFQDWEVASAPHRIRPQQSMPIAPGGRITVYVGRGTATRSTLYMGKPSSIFDTGGDAVVLTAPGGDVADCFAYGFGSCAAFAPKAPVPLPVMPVGRRVPAGGQRCFVAVGAKPGEFVALNITPLDATTPGFGAAHSSDDPAGGTSSVNFARGTVDPNVSLVRVGRDGRVCFTNSVHGAVHVIADAMVVGSPAVFRAPSKSGSVRLADTRRGVGGGLVAPNERRCVAASGRAGEFAGLNVTPVDAAATGFGTMHSSDTDAGSTSNVNFSRGSVDPNLALVQIGRDGKVCFTNSEHGAVHLVLDQAVTAGGAVFRQPSTAGAVRLADTRSGAGGGRLRPRTTRCLDTVGTRPGDWVGVNVTPVEASMAGFGTIHSSDDPAGSSSNVNFGPGTVDPNVAFARVGEDGRICFTNSEHGAVHLIVDQIVVGDGAALRQPTARGAVRLVDSRLG